MMPTSSGYWVSDFAVALLQALAFLQKGHYFGYAV